MSLWRETPLVTAASARELVRSGRSDDEIRGLWKRQRDTAQIAALLGVREYEIANRRIKMSLIETPPKLIGAASAAYWKGNNPWTAARLELLTRLWADGQSAGAIARQIDHPFTRSAILGKVHRLKLSSRADIKPHAKTGNRFTNRRPDGFRRKALPKAPTVAKPVLVRAEFVAAPARPEATCTFDQLSRGMCRFPYGDPGAVDFTYCGRLAAGTYCAGHHQLCYRRSA